MSKAGGVGAAAASPANVSSLNSGGGLTPPPPDLVGAPGCPYTPAEKDYITAAWRSGIHSSVIASNLPGRSARAIIDWCYRHEVPFGRTLQRRPREPHWPKLATPDGRTARISPVTMAIFTLLQSRHGSCVSVEELSSVPGCKDQTVVCSAVHKLRSLGFQVATVYGRGYGFGIADAFWTDAEVEFLKCLLREKKPASQIARILGKASKSAVLGKIRRLGLAVPRSASANPRPRRPHRRPRGLPLVPAPPLIVRLIPEVPPPPPEGVPALDNRGCTFILSMRGSMPYCCGQRLARPGGSWCTQHMAQFTQGTKLADAAD